MKKLIFSLSTLLILFSGCELLENVAEEASTVNIAQGLKEALKVGTDTATSKLAVVDGYLKDEAVKILLPDEMEEKIAQFKAIEINVFGIGTVTGETLYTAGLPALGINSLSSYEDDLILGINRAAESAANEAGPIFFDAITSITISDAENILYGSDTAATAYLIDRTYQSLFQTYEPKLDAAVNSVTIGDKTVEEVYANFVNEYNSILATSIPTGFSSSSLGDIAGITPIENPDISAHATEKGLNGLFLKVQEEEKNIREDPLARVTDLLEDVFGLLD